MSVKRKLWTDERIKREILKCSNDLGIDRMPTSTELRKMGRNDLHMAIQRSKKKYSGWADYFMFDRKDSETIKGLRYEELVYDKIKSLGHTVERMTTKHPYDLLVDNAVKVDVKSGSAYLLRGESRVHSFGISKKNATCDIYIVLALDEKGTTIEKTFVIPSHHLKVVSLCIGKQSKYNRFIDRWDYIEQYSNFYNSVS